MGQRGQNVSYNQNGVYGTLGVPAAANVPGSREEAIGWTDSSGALWLFSGWGYDSTRTLGFLNDLWRFDPSTNQWTWMAGSTSLPNASDTCLLGVYGNIGTPSAANIPGGRNLAVSWTDTAGNFWLFGGGGCDAAGTQGLLNDLWKFTPSTGQWTRIAGSSTVAYTAAGHAGVRAVSVESWLGQLPLAPATRSKTRNILSALYEHAMRYGWATANPIKQVRQSAKRLTEPDVLTVEEIAAILARLTEPCRTLTLAAALTGLRRGELFGLQWQDVEFDSAVIHVRRSIVDQVVGSTKTVGSNRPLPVNLELSKALAQWKLMTRYAKPSDWVFASPSSRGLKPYWANTLLSRHIRPAALPAGIGKVIGWHTFRRSFATLLQSSGASVKVTQELMRHSSPMMTLGTYAQAVTSDKREAQDTIAAMIVPNREAETGTLAA